MPYLFIYLFPFIYLFKVIVQDELTSDDKMTEIKADCSSVGSNENMKPLRSARWMMLLLHKGVAAHRGLVWMEQQCRLPAIRL